MSAFGSDSSGRLLLLLRDDNAKRPLFVNMTFYPVNLRIKDRLCLVIGGGAVALRKTRSLLEAGARVRVVSPELAGGLRTLVAEWRVEWVERGYVTGDLRGAFLAFAATGEPTVQDKIMVEAEERAVLVNSADDPFASNFHVPAHFRRGKMLLTVSTGGGSPALARRLRKQLEEEFGREYGAVVDLLAMIREAVVPEERDAEGHRRLFNRLLDLGIVDLILKRDWFQLQMLLLHELPETCDGVALLKTFLEKHDREA